MSSTEVPPVAPTTRRDRHERQQRRGGGFLLGTVGVLGELLITAGVLLLAFLAWQLWWTDVEANSAQAAIVEEQGWDVPLQPVGDEGPTVVTPRYDDPPVLDEPEYLTTFASMRVPRWDGEPTRTITQGTDRPRVLNPLGVGHYEGTAMPGGVGNFALAAHRTTYGKPFNRIEELQEGDPIVVWTQDTWYVYRVTASEVVMPQDVRVIAPVPNQPDAEPTERYITLTTCHPMFSARERYIVHGVLDYWAPVSEGVPAELAEVS
ncbi:class E sortase [Cellulomonas triticagri]|uniref:Class E sortase n=1 Tax=Cellulomonas triticagri TaxID=2483352 RepID=A0A3M2JMP8_9CELL|nr:class E sortase [Cellulomonas triticagri]RMI14454.1 class E sortase [Cellulomonas triticagri]